MLVKRLLNLPEVLWEGESEISGKIKVVQRGKERQLLVGELVQSINADALGIEKRVWGEMVSTAVRQFGPPARRLEPSGDWRAGSEAVSRVLILGLGGGTAAHLLTQKFGPILIDGVEIDPKIVEVGRRFFGLNDLSNLNIIIADALKFITRYPLPPTHYSLIIVDVYQGSKFPTACESDEFLAALTSFLDPKGLVVLNRIFFEWEEHKLKKFIDKLKEFFDNVKIRKVPGGGISSNILFICRRGGEL